MDFGFLDIGHLDGLTQEYGLVFRTLDFGLVFLLDVGLLNHLFNYVKIELNSALFIFQPLLFAHLLGKLIRI